MNAGPKDAGHDKVGRTGRDDGQGVRRDEHAVHDVDRARLTEHADLAPPVHRYPPQARHTDLVRHYWVPVWDLPDDTVITEQVLQYPSPLIVVAQDYARFYGVVPGLSTRQLRGSGWAVGVMLRGGAAPTVLGRGDVSDLADSHLPLADLPGLSGRIEPIRAAMAPAPSHPDRHQTAIALLEQALDELPPISPEGLEVTAIVQLVEGDPQLLTVGELVARSGLSERTLQRLIHRHLGLSPKWLIQRRRLQEAAHQLKHGGRPLAQVAVDLGYSDQAHFTRDFHRVTGYRPGQFARTLGGAGTRTPR